MNVFACLISLHPAVKALIPLSTAHRGPGAGLKGRDVTAETPDQGASPERAKHVGEDRVCAALSGLDAVGRIPRALPWAIASCPFSPNSEVTAVPAMGGTGHRPVPGGNLPPGTGKAPGLFRTARSHPVPPPLPPGQWPGGTGW